MLALTVIGLIGALNCTSTRALAGTAVAPFAGLKLVTAGATVRVPVPVLKLVTVGLARGSPT